MRVDEQGVGAGPRPLGERATLVYHRLSPYSRGVVKYRFSLASGGGKADQRNVDVEVFRVLKATDRDKKTSSTCRGELNPGVAERIDALSRRLPLRLGERQAFPFDEDPAKKVAEKAAEKAAEKPKADANNGGGRTTHWRPILKPAIRKPPMQKTQRSRQATPRPCPSTWAAGSSFASKKATPAEEERARVVSLGRVSAASSAAIRKSTATYDADRRKLEVLVHPNNNLPYPLDGFLVEWGGGGDERGHHRVEWIAGRSRHTAARHRAARDSQFLPKTDKDTLDVFVAVDGYPRAFYPVMVNGGAIATPSTATFRRVRVSPVDAQVFKGDPDAADPFPILVEARFDDIPEERDKIQVMFDDGQATTERLASSRARHAYFTLACQARARRSRSVGDYVRDLKRKTDGDALKFTTTSRDKVIRITAEIAGVSENYRDTPPTRSVLVDYRDPTVTASSLRAFASDPEEAGIDRAGRRRGGRRGVAWVEYYRAAG